MTIDSNLFRGELVRLTVEDPETYAKAFTPWRSDTYFWRLMESWPAQMSSEKAMKEWLEKEFSSADPGFYFFCIRTLEDDRLIGDVGIPAQHDGNGDTVVGIALGERDYWGKGYGTDAMRILLRYAFTELNLHRVSLDVFEYNPRAIRSYEKAGFRREGCERGFLNREGRRWDLIHMGILRSEWEAIQA